MLFFIKNVIVAIAEFQASLRGRLRRRQDVIGARSLLSPARDRLSQAVGVVCVTELGNAP